MSLQDEGTVSYEEIYDRCDSRVQHVLRYFEFGHLPPELQAISKPFADLAYRHAAVLDGPELTVGLRKLLEAKDCMVRAALDAPAGVDPRPDFTRSHPLRWVPWVAGFPRGRATG